MMQLFQINDPAVIYLNKKMATLGESLETNNLTLDTVNCSNNVSQNENSTPSANVNVKNETINGMNQASLNINGILKINGPEIGDETGNDQAVVENKIKTNGQTNGNSVPNVDCKISANMNSSEINLEDKGEIKHTNDLKVKESKNIVNEVSSEIPAINETKKTGENTSIDIDILIGDNVTASHVLAFSPNSEADEKEINISSQLQQLENDASIDDDANPTTSDTKEINKEIVQETSSKDISLNLIEENQADSSTLLEKEASYEVVTNETEQTVLPCRDSPIINAKNNGISEESKSRKSETDVDTVDEVSEISDNITHKVDNVFFDKPSVEDAFNLPIEELSKDTNQKETIDIDASEISDNISHKVDHVITDKPSVEEASNLPLKELSRETNQKETMDIDDEQIDPASQDVLKHNTQNNEFSEKTSENESMVDIILNEAPIISDYISTQVDKNIIDKKKLEEASNVPLEGPFEETSQKETIDINAPVISDNISNKVDHVIIDKPSVEKAFNLPLEEHSKDTNQKETMDIDDEQIDPASCDVLKPNTQNNGISEKASEKESMVDIILDEALIISDSVSPQVDKEIIGKQNLEKASNLSLEGSCEETNQKETIDMDAAKETNNEVKVDENDEMLNSQVMDDDGMVVCTLEKHRNAVKIISNRHDSIKNSNEGTNSAEKDVEPADHIKETKTETTEADGEIPSKEVNQNYNVVMDIDEAEEISSEKSPLPTHVDTNEINIETKTDETLTVNVDAVEVERKQKVNVDMDIDDVEEEVSTVVSTLDSDNITKKNNTETKSNEENPTEKDSFVCLTDKNKTNVKGCTLMDSGVKDHENSEVISIEESENDENKEKPVISHCSVAPVESKEKLSLIIPEKKLPVLCKLSNTMDILSDDEDEPSAKSIESMKEKVDEEPKKAAEENKCINLDDDDDIMFIEDTNSQEPKPEHNETQLKPEVDKTNDKANFNIENENSTAKSEEEVPNFVEEGKLTTDEAVSLPKEDETIPTKTSEVPKPIITKTFLQSVTKNLADMTRNELEDFCILKLVESVVDKSNLNEIKSKMKTMTQTLEDLRKKTVALTKQNRDLQVVVKTVQEDQKKRNTNPMMPMKITRSVGMQVVLTGEKSLQKRKPIIPTQPPPPTTPAKPARTSQSPKIQSKPQANIPVPRLVPASSPTLKPPAATVTNAKVTVKNATPQRPEKRPHNKITSPTATSVTVDLTDDEPPSKITTKNPTPPVRLVPSQNLMPKNRPQFTPNTSNNSARESPRKVYIPISSNNPRPAVGKNFAPTPRSRPPVIHPSVVRMQTVRVNQVTTSNRHPAPLPDAMKQYQPPAWKALPPAPDLKLSKVDSGIVISWKFEGYQPDSYEEVASFQLYAYQETPAPPSTTLWKKIGDIKALPLPMACTLTQFMSGFKYYFAVRAIDVRSRIGPFSLPGSIMLISKN